MNRGNPRIRQLLDAGWRFHLGEVSLPALPATGAAYQATHAGNARGAAAATFDDSDWAPVDLPHDWAVATPFDPAENGDHGYHTRGIGWYRRYFRLDPADAGRHLTVEFAGVLTHCTVWCNGHLLARNYCGYTPFVVDITDVARYGDQVNVLAVRVDATVFEGWWYEGAGIYRHVWLTKTAALHVAPWGVWVNPQWQTGDAWDTAVETTVANAAEELVAGDLVARLWSPAGEVVTETQSALSVAAGETVVSVQHLPVTAPVRWDLYRPQLYRLQTQLVVAGAVVDESWTTFGYRTFRFDPELGFFLNERPLKLKGTANHQDHAGVGAAVPDALHAWRLARLQTIGCNAYRCAHHPPAPELLDAADRLGMLVLDENRNFSAAPEGLAQLRQMVRRDRNHPCVVLWAVFNEEALQGTPVGQKLARRLLREVHRLDPTRPVTAAMCGGILNPDGVGVVVDAMGINYNQGTYDDYHRLHPQTPIVATESNAGHATRGIHLTSTETRYFDNYDEQHAPFGATAQQAWANVQARPFIAGYFIWTGFDYRGEPAPHTWPCINSTFGLFDTCGFPKDVAHLHRALWTTEPLVHLLPHWNWAGQEGQPIRVQCYSNCEEVELWLNGRSQGVQPFSPTTAAATWQVPYTPGELLAVGRRRGREVARASVVTTGPATALTLTAERETPAADGEDVLPVAVSAVDAAGRVVPTAMVFVQFELAGAGRILGVGNGDPRCHEADRGTGRSLFNGWCQVLLQAGTEPGIVRLAATAAGLAPGELRLTLSPADRRPVVPPAAPS